jgi:3-hydroxybutyryl-CoA dehydrogenase
MRVSVLGSGVMGKQISLLFADCGCQVVIWNHILRNGLSNELKRGAKLWKLDFQKVKNNIVLTENLRELVGSPLVIETVIEDFAIKSKILREVSSLVDFDAAISSNTSSLSIDALSKSVCRPERFHGLHFFNPPQQIKFVELSRATCTTDETVKSTVKVLEQFSISYIVIQDSPGFVVNNLLFSMINSAISLLQNSGLQAGVIDDAVKFGAKHPMGPLELADFIGLDTCLKILNNLYDRTKDKKYEPSKLLEQLVENRELGRKTGKGFHKYGQSIILPQNWTEG